MILSREIHMKEISREFHLKLVSGEIHTPRFASVCMHTLITRVVQTTH